MSKTEKKRILYFTLITPSEKFGGGIAVLQSIYSLCKIAELDYIGPIFDKNEFDNYGIRISDSYILTQNFGIIKRLTNLFFKGVSTSFYESWKNTVQKIDSTRYDCCYLDFTRHSFVVKWAKGHNLPIVVRAHNVEFDYISSIFKKQPSISSFIKKINLKKSESYCIHSADKILTLTNNDKKRLIDLYGTDTRLPLFIFPICVKHFNTDYNETLPKKFVSITGSLWFGPNVDGTLWFLRNVWPKIDKELVEKYTLVIAGAKPNNEIKQLVNESNNVRLFENPDKIDSFYQQASVYIAPIFYGAGMKVKVAEALSCGIPVITTDHAISGYESVSDLLNVCKTDKEFVESLESLLRKSDEEMAELKRKILEGFENNFSLNNSVKIMKTVISEVIH